jgi:CheY-like chemotaxis protein/anti-sigma regulatory factor (Ser/Thr protein kinase)
MPAQVHTDQKRLRQILINLLSNAIKYTECGSVTLAVRYRSPIAELEIIDTGVGIAVDDRELIFEPFERGSSERARSVPGTGLGLTITKLLTQIMGGEIQVRSDSSGSSFTVRLMLSEVMEPTQIPRSTHRFCDYAGPRRTVLLADDDPLHLELVQNLLAPLGFEVFTARDGKTCVQLAQQCRPDLLLLDVSMPDISGWEALRQLRACPELAHMKIMIVSANAHEYSTSADAGHDHFVTKPVDMSLLLREIGNLLGLRWIEQPEPSSMPSTTSSTSSTSSGSAARHHLDDLYRLGRIGHVRGIEAKLRELELEDPANETVATQLRALVTSFDMKRYMNVLEAMRANA